MSLKNLPNELQILISKVLQPGSLVKLMASSKHFHSIGLPVLRKALEDPYYKIAALYCAAANGDRTSIKTILELDDTILVGRATDSVLVTGEPQHPIGIDVEVALEQGVNVFLSQNSTREFMSALSWAAQHSHVGVLKLALRKGVNREWLNHNGQTALHTALETGDKTIIQLLLEGGADANAPDDTGDMPLMIEAKGAMCGDILKMLLQKGAEPNARNIAEGTALHFAVMMQNEDGVKTLLEYGADPDGGYHTGGRTTTPLHLAVRRQEAIVKLLLQSGADPGVEDNDDKTPFELAEGSMMESARCLLVGLYRSNPSKVFSNGRTYTHLAAQYSYIQFLEELIESGENLGAVDLNGRTPLHMAARSDYVDCVALLIKGGVNIDPVDNFGNTPLHLAATILELNAYRALLKMGSMSFTWRDGVSQHTPIHIAAWTLLGPLGRFKDSEERLMKLREVVRLERELLKEVLDIRKGLGHDWGKV